MKLVTSDKKYFKYVMIPNFKDGHTFSKHLFAVKMGKTEITMDKPVYLGQVILDLSKMLMYEFHYDYMRPKYGSKVKLCYMDTVSFVYEIETKDFYKDIAKDVEKMFDTSRYSKDYNRPLPIGNNKKKIGLKDEIGGKIMTWWWNDILEQMLFDNKKYDVYTVNKHKIALNRDNDKRLVQADGITTLARGYVAASA